MSRLPGDLASSVPFVSVIVPCFGHMEALECCLAALQRQDYPKDRFEVLVVDNHPETVICVSTIWPQNARVLHEPRPGSYAARNCGAQAAKGVILAFTDSDCAPRADWLSEAVSALQLGHDRVAGKVSPTKQAAKETFVQQFDELTAFDQKAYVARGVSVTANLIIWRRVYQAVGPFDESLFSGGDFEWSHRATQSSFNLTYCERAIVCHASRAKLSDLLKKRRRVATGWLPAASKGAANSKLLCIRLRDWLPSLVTTRHIISAEGVSLVKKICFVVFAYFLKFYGSIWRCCFLRGWVSASRV